MPKDKKFGDSETTRSNLGDLPVISEEHPLMLTTVASPLGPIQVSHDGCLRLSQEERTAIVEELRRFNYMTIEMKEGVIKKLLG